ncbi:M20/M25/M40 family metallo-hydrolase [Dictyobacter kobayashii]|uniref:Dipeptidase n=1 Tax=Dictyobacter kobayashii TaxID=2014872 RepID=A0A402APX4_9CHLR|nr:M20/M25/M40 family metallo-hydrolase [Dictyobacter kobayashii]GCE21218.1 dipeptidase [Dictyobacter kobayashii]
MSREDLRQAVHQAMPATLDDLATLVRIPSVAAEGFSKEPVLEAAHATRDILQRVGFQDVRLLDIPTGYPAVYGEIPGPAGTPTVLLYAHYDVQPAGAVEAWETPPFELTPRQDGRLYGRGAADDKSGIAIHLATLRSFAGQPPVGLKIIVEGEEEFGSSLEAYLLDHADLFQADVVVVADAGNNRVGEPLLTTTLRGEASLVVEVRTLQGPVHSGAFGGPTPDALVALIRMIATLHDAPGNVAVTGMQGQSWSGTDISEAEFRYLAGVLPGVDLMGTDSIATRVCSSYSINVVGLDAPAVQGSRNALIDVARARISVRVPPERSAKEALELLTAHLKVVAPWNVQLAFSEQESGEGHAAATDGPAYTAAYRALRAAYGKEASEVGSGGSIPLINAFARVFPQAEIILWGAEDASANIHAPNESVDPAELERAALAEAYFLHDLGTTQKPA